jgi:MarR family
MPPFSFLTNHGLALLCIAQDPRVRVREIAATVDITERAAQRIVSDLIGTGYVTRIRDGRRNVYTVRTDLPVALPSRRDIDLNSLLSVLLPAYQRREEMTVAG